MLFYHFLLRINFFEQDLFDDPKPTFLNLGLACWLVGLLAGFLVGLVACAPVVRLACLTLGWTVRRMAQLGLLSPSLFSLNWLLVSDVSSSDLDSWCHPFSDTRSQCATVSNLASRELACRFLGPLFFLNPIPNVNCRQSWPPGHWRQIPGATFSRTPAPKCVIVTRYGHPRLKHGIALGWIGPGDPFLGPFAPSSVAGGRGCVWVWVGWVCGLGWLVAWWHGAGHLAMRKRKHVLSSMTPNPRPIRISSFLHTCEIQHQKRQKIKPNHKNNLKDNKLNRNIWKSIFLFPRSF